MRAKGALMLDPHGALICTMMMVSAADRDMTESELAIIGDIVGALPVSRDFGPQQRAADCVAYLGRLLFERVAQAAHLAPEAVHLVEQAEHQRHRLVIDREFAPDIEDQLDPGDI